MTHDHLLRLFAVSFALLLSLPCRGQELGPQQGVLLESRGGAKLSLGFGLESGSTRREYAGHVALTLPLDRIAAPRRVAADPSVDSAAAEAPAAEPAEAVPEAQGEHRAPPPAEPEPASLSTGAFLALSRATVQKALSHAGADRALEQLESLSARARASALLPELRLRAARSNDEALRLTPTSDDPYRYSLAGGTDLLLEATATWDLDRLLFAGEEVALSRLSIEREKARAALVERVLEQLFLFRRALAVIEDRGATSEEKLAAELRLVEASAALDALTAGWFGERLRYLGLAGADAAEEAPPGPAEPPLPVARAEPRKPDRLWTSPADCAKNAAPCWLKPGTVSRTSKGVSLR